MRYFYLDASAMAKRYTPEPGDAVVDHLFTRLIPDRLLVLNIGIAEVVSILVRKRNVRIISQSSYAQALANFRAEVINQVKLYKIIPETALVTDALPLIDNHSINATDAVSCSAPPWILLIVCVLAATIWFWSLPISGCCAPPRPRG